jgi:hypothetical protein
MPAKRIFTNVSPKAAHGLSKVLDRASARYGVKRDAKTGEYAISIQIADPAKETIGLDDVTTQDRLGEMILSLEDHLAL